MVDNSRINNSMKNLFYGTIKYLIMIVVPFIIRTILIYKLGTEYAGVTSLFSSILQVLSLTELGFSSAVVFSLYDPVARNDNAKISALLGLFKRIYIVCGTIILVIGFCICPFIKILITGDYPLDINIYLIFIMLLVNTAVSYLLCGYKSVLFIAFQRDDVVSKCQILSNILMYILQIVNLLTQANYTLYVVCMILGTVANSIFMYIYSKRMFPDITACGIVDENEKKHIYSNVKALFGHQLDMVVITSADNIVISAFIGLYTLTVYNNYYYVVSAVLSMLIMVANAFVASIGNSIAIENMDKNYKDFLSFTYSLGIVNVGATVMMLVLFQDFMEIWMGASRLFDFSTVVLLVFSFYIRQFRRSILTYKNASGVWHLDKYKPYVAAGFNVIINIILVKIVGINGVIISTILSMVLIEIPWETMAIFKGYFKRNVTQYFRIQTTLIFKLMIISSICLYLGNLYHAVSIFQFLIKGVVTFIFTSLLLFVLSARDYEFKVLFIRLKNLFKRK